MGSTGKIGDGLSDGLEGIDSVYCTGPLLHQVQMLKVFPDGKDFVDMPIKASSSPSKVLTDFEALSKSKSNEKGQIDKDELREFVLAHFDPPGSDLKQHNPNDYNPDLPSIDQIQELYRPFAVALHRLWPTLCRVSSSQYSYSTLIQRQYPMIVPGDRFRESYYWDSAWAIKGLLISGMHSTAWGVACNLLADVEKYGFVPNGGRIYYRGRSQPPLLTEMVNDVIIDAGVNTEEASQMRKKALPLLEKEFDYWMKKKSVLLEGRYTMATFGERDGGASSVGAGVVSGPRPESYREDFDIGNDEIYPEIRATAESGWDFSSRWGGDVASSGKGWKGLSAIRTRSIVPVDLNVILARAASQISAMFKSEKDEESAKRFQQKADALRTAITDLMWDSEASLWRDLVLSAGCRDKGAASGDEWQRSAHTTPACFFPLWLGIKEERAVDALKASGLVQRGGVMSSLNRHSNEQWDGTNVWAPIQWLIVDSLVTLGTPEAVSLAEKIADGYLHAAIGLWEHGGLMHEKYNAEEPEKGPGAGGEYTPQVGFTWSNAVALDFLYKFKKATTKN